MSDPKQLLSLVGAFLILAAFAANSFGWLDAKRASYQWLNLVGAALLTASAVLTQNVGFILLEGAWTLVSAGMLVKLLIARQAGT